MARFKAYLKGNRGETSRLGSKSSGLKATVNGWDLGVCVYAYVDERQEDVFEIYKTKGTNDAFTRELICKINSKEARLNDLLKGAYFET